jgi:hypothetical protein
MNLFDNLASHGLTIDVLQVLIVSVAIIAVIGMFWHVIVIGLGAMFCVYVLAATPTETNKTLDKWKEEHIIKPEDLKKIDFMKDCQAWGESKERCDGIWTNKEQQ